MSPPRLTVLFPVIALVAILVGPTLGCATANPALHPAAAGKALRVETDAAVVAKMESKVAKEEGILTFSIGGDMGREVQPRTFQLLHGEKAIDEQDFYEVAGDNDAARQVKDYRDTQMLLQYLGYYGAQFPAGMGCLVTAFGCVWSGVSLVIFPPFVVFGAVFTGVAALLATGFEVVGLSLGNVARGNMLRRSYVLPLTRAQAAAAAYNKKHGFLAPAKPVEETPQLTEAPPSTTVELSDDTACVNAEALQRDLEALGSGRVRARVRVEAKEGGVRKVHLSLFSGRVGAPSVSRDFEIAASECNDVPRMVTRIARAQLGESP